MILIRVIGMQLTVISSLDALCRQQACQDAAAANAGAVVVLHDLLENGVVIRRIFSQSGLLERAETQLEHGCLSCTVRLDLVPTIERLLERGEAQAIIGLPPAVCRSIYFDNATKLLARSLPLPVMKAARVETDFKPDGKLSNPAWSAAVPVRLEYESGDASARPDISTAVRALWSDQFLYLAYESPFSKLDTFTPVQAAERIGLWDKDVVEAFIAADPAKPNHYIECEWSPSGEQLDLKVELPAKDFPWSSGMESSVSIDEPAKMWRLEVRIPLKSLSSAPPQAGTRWRLNLFRHDTASSAGLAFSPALTGTFHTPERFGWLEFTKP